ncbi:MAG: T9SS type A sorting domain-containing protein [Runella sp.]
MRLLFLLFLLGLQLSFAQSTTTWNVDYDDDKFSADALLDLRYLNEKIAGENGFVRLSPDGRSFLLGNGQPARFWAVNGGDITKNWTDVQLANFARFLAKVGVNMIRYHGNIAPRPSQNNLFEPDMDEIRNIWRVVAAMKREGIYTVISPFWAGFINEMPASWGLGEYRGNVQPWALMYFNERFKSAYKKWVEVLFTQPNPFTNIPLKDEPAVALIQIKNEDSVLFWTIQAVKNDLKEAIEKAFFQWAIAKYGSAQATLQAWENATTPTDNLANQRFGIYLIYDATIRQSGGKAKRVSDMVQFLTEYQRAFYTDIIAHFKNLGCKQLTNASNWKTASSIYLNDAERWSNEVADVMAVNRYYDPQHIGENSGWRIDPGHQYIGRSVLFRPEQFPLNVKQNHNKPFFITESGWNLPLKFQAEGPFLVAAYSSLMGIDGFFWFQASASGIDAFPYFGFTNLQGGQKAMYRWTYSTPGQIMLSPANALLYRKGYLTESPLIVSEERSLASMWERKIPLISEENSFDPNRDTWENTAGSTPQTELPPISYLAGRIEVKYNAPADAKKIDNKLNEWVNLKDKIVKSSTGQLLWDYKKGICTVDAPAAQGIVGFLKNGSPITQLTDLKIESQNEYAAVNVVSMDEKPLKSSEKVLVQIGTTYRPFQWSEITAKVKIGEQELDGFTIRNTGVMPWLAENTQITLTLNNLNIRSAFLLDLNGQKSREVLVLRENGQAKITLPQNAMYVVLSNAPPTITSTSSEKKTEIEVFPNPANDEVVIQLNESSNSHHTISVLTVEGKSLYTLQNSNKPLHRIDTQLWPSGVYWVIVESENHKISKKIIIEH